MARTILDGDLRSWEAFASTGPYGYSQHSQLVFQCTTDPGERPRAHRLSGDKSDAEALLVGASREELRSLLAESDPLE